MDAQQTGGRYELVVWAYDGAPDAEEYRNPDGCVENIAPYYVWERVRVSDVERAKSLADRKVREEFFVGAAVFRDGELVAGYGLTFPYR